MAAANQFQITLDIPQFQGNPTDNISDWFSRIEDTIRPLAEDDEDLNDRLASILPQKLTSSAYKVYRDLPTATKADYEACKAHLGKIFNNQDFIRVFQGSLTARPRHQNEHIDVYVAELRNLVSQAFPDYSSTQQEAETFRRFIRGVSTYLRGKIFEHDPQDIEEAVRICKNAERAQTEYQSIDPTQGGIETRPSTMVAQIEPVTDNSLLSESVLHQLLDEFKKLTLALPDSNTISSELKRQNDMLQRLAEDAKRDRDNSRSRDYTRRRDHYRAPSRQNYPDRSWSRDSSRGYNTDRHRVRSYRSGSRDFSYNGTQSYDRPRRSNRDRSYTRGSESPWRRGQSPHDRTYPPSHTNNNGRNYSGDRRSPDRQRANYPAPRHSYSRSPSASRNPSYSPHRRVSFNLQENE